jgi:hypothetical protein
MSVEMRPNRHAAAANAVVFALFELTMAAVALCVTAFVSSYSYARDDGRFAKLHSRNGSNGLRAEMDYAARLPMVSVCRMSIGMVPDAAVVTEPNRFGPAVVWPYNDRYGNTRVRCFMPGAGT